MGIGANVRGNGRETLKTGIVGTGVSLILCPGNERSTAQKETGYASIVETQPVSGLPQLYCRGVTVLMLPFEKEKGI